MEAGRGAGFFLVSRGQEQEEKPPQPPPTPPAGGLPDWRQVTVGFIAGALVATLAVLQVRELRRKKVATGNAATTGDEGTPA
jgi:hypothetical protein